MASPHCKLAQSPNPLQVAPEIASECVLGCLEGVCCYNSEKGEKYELCLAQLRKRLGDDPEPGDKCGSCGLSW